MLINSRSLLLFELRPPLLQERGLAAALPARLQAVEARAGVVAEFASESDQRLAPDKEQELYRLAQDALNNVLKHAHAARVTVRLVVVNGEATLEIADDGVRFKPALRVGDGFGLPGMRERVERLAGNLNIESSPGAGTRVHVEVPVSPTESIGRFACSWWMTTPWSARACGHCWSMNQDSK